MRKRIKPMIVGLCIWGLLFTGCGKEEENHKTTTEQNESTDNFTTQEDEDTEPVDAPVGMIESCELTQLEGKEIISVSVVGDGETLYVSTCFEEMELAMPVYEVLRFDYQESLDGYGEPVKMEWDKEISCIYFTTNQSGTKAYLSVLAENQESEEAYSLRLATAEIEGNQLKNITLLSEMEEEGNQIVSGVDDEETIYYVAEDMENGTLVAKVAYVKEGYIAQELFEEGCIMTAALQEEITKEAKALNEIESENRDDEVLKDSDENESFWNENSVLWEEIVNIRSIVKSEDGRYYFTAPGPNNGVYMIYMTQKHEDGLFTYPELLPKEINDGVEDKLYCTVSTDEKYLYYISSKSFINEDGEFYSKTMLYRVEREKLNQDYVVNH